MSLHLTQENPQCSRPSRPIINLAPLPLGTSSIVLPSPTLLWPQGPAVPQTHQVSLRDLALTTPCLAPLPSDSCRPHLLTSFRSLTRSPLLGVSFQGHCIWRAPVPAKCFLSSTYSHLTYSILLLLILFYFFMYSGRIQALWGQRLLSVLFTVYPQCLE